MPFRVNWEDAIPPDETKAFQVSTEANQRNPEPAHTNTPEHKILFTVSAAGAFRLTTL